MMALVVAKQRYVPQYQVWIKHLLRAGRSVSQTPLQCEFQTSVKTHGGGKEKCSSVLTTGPSVVSPENRVFFLFSSNFTYSP